MCHKVYRTLARSFRGMYPQSLSVYFSKPLSNKLSLFLLYVIASARGRANIHGVPRRRPSRDSLTLLPERAAACPLTVRRVALCGRGSVEGGPRPRISHVTHVTGLWIRDVEVRGQFVGSLTGSVQSGGSVCRSGLWREYGLLTVSTAAACACVRFDSICVKCT
jgi:hypothetical protein